MRREKDYREKKTGKRLLTSISCLLLLSGMVLLFTYMIGETVEGKEGRICLEEIAVKTENGVEFDNPIDDLYLPAIEGSSIEDRKEMLSDYEKAWRGQLEGYLGDYASRCSYARDKKMAEDYLEVIYRAVDAQKELMKYMGMEEEMLCWHSAQIYRCAFSKDIGGKFSSGDMEQGAVQLGIEGSEEEFDLGWCNELGELTLEFYENLDEEGKRLAGIWQESREEWKAAADGRMWHSPEELNESGEDAFILADGMETALMEKNGWINKLYCQQLQSMMGRDSKELQSMMGKDSGEAQSVYRQEHEGEALGTNGYKVLLELLLEGKGRAPLSTYPLNEEAENDCNQVWQICSGILGEKDADTWEHDTWYMKNRYTGKKSESDMMILYRTEEGEQGFFCIKAGILYRVRADENVKEDLSVIREQIEDLGKEEEEENSKKEGDKTRWEALLWKAWEGLLPDDGFRWEDEKVRKAVYNQISYSGIVPSREELTSLSSLQVRNAEDVRTFGDLEKLPHLTSLELSGTGEINYDIDKDTLPALEELFFSYISLDSAEFLEELPDIKVLGVICGELTDISFLENYPHLIEVSFYGNEISDISPLENCKDLEIVSLANNNLSDISVLSRMPKLREVGLQGNHITDIRAVENLDGLEALNLNDNEIEDISPLEELKELTSLGVAANQIKDITPLKGLTGIYNLSLDENEISSIDALRDMKDMEYLGLSGNQIKDFSPLMGMEKLYYLSVWDNPGQDIGKLIFTPWLILGRGYETSEQELEEMQSYLNQYYPGEETLAQDFAKGDLNGDGIEDVAIVGLGDKEEESVYAAMRYVCPLINKGDGTFIPLEPLESLGPDMGGIYGDPYQGILITDGMLAVQVYGGSNWRWGSTNVYQYEEGEMKETWEISLGHFAMTSGMDFTIHDKVSDCWKHYVAVGEEERHKEILLIAENNGEADARMEELDVLLGRFEEKVQKPFPEVRPDIAAPELDGWYDYHICSYPVTREPVWVLKQTAEELLKEALPLPAVYYTSEEIRESYGRLIGVEPPEVFYIGTMEEEPVLLYYNGCLQKEDGFVHEMVICRPDEKNEYWREDCRIYYDENTDMTKESIS